MCLIIICPPGTNKNDEFLFDSIRNGYEKNRDGSGFAFNSKGKTFVSKGYMDAEVLIKGIKEASIDTSETLIIHHRLGNCGDKTIKNMHPFVISDKDEEITTVEDWVDKPVLFHNGTFYKYKDWNEKVFSDTYLFVKKFMSVPEVYSVFQRDMKLFEDLFEDHLRTKNSNKIAVLAPEGNFYTSGFFIEKNGFMFSNYQFEAPKKVENNANQNCRIGPQLSMGLYGGDCMGFEGWEDFNDPVHDDSLGVVGSGGTNQKIGFQFRNQSEDANRSKDSNSNNATNGVTPLDNSSDLMLHRDWIDTKALNEYIYYKPIKDFMGAVRGQYYVLDIDYKDVDSEDWVLASPAKNKTMQYLFNTKNWELNTVICAREEYKQDFADYKTLCKTIIPTQTSMSAVATTLSMVLKTDKKECKHKKMNVSVKALVWFYNKYKHLIREGNMRVVKNQQDVVEYD